MDLENNLAYGRFSPCRSLPGVHLRERLEVAPHSEAATDSAFSIAGIGVPGNKPPPWPGAEPLQPQLDQYCAKVGIHGGGHADLTDGHVRVLETVARHDADDRRPGRCALLEQPGD